MDINEIKERDRSGQIQVDDRTVILRRGLVSKRMTRDFKAKLRQAGKLITEEPENTKAESFATETGVKAIKKETTEGTADVKRIGEKSVRETIKTVREQVKIKKNQNAAGRRSVPLSQEHTPISSSRSVPMSQSQNSPQVGMQRYAKKQLIKQKVSPMLRVDLQTGSKPGLKARVSGRKVLQKIGETLKKAFKTGKTTMTAILAAGWVGIMLIVSVSMIGALANTPLGLFFSGGVKRVSMASVIRDINYDFDNEIAALKSMYVYDELNITGRKSLWKDVLSIYAVRTSMNREEPGSVAMITEENRELLKEIFWTMNSLSSSLETKLIEVDDPGSGPGSDNLSNDPVYEEKTILTIEVEHLTAETMALVYEFDQEQMTALDELLKPEYNEVWTMLLYGTTGGDVDILQVALSQMGNQGGVPYWAWWGYTSKVDWCAIFVSWCAYECGYLEKGVFPKFQGVGTGLNWFKDRGQFREPDMYEPMPGDIIFFDWADDGFDGKGDHVGIVEKVENGIVWTVEGNRTDSVSQGAYSLQSEVIIGYGVVVK